jgi:peptidoglycan/LPS O-acetylase OafA/YrhL
MSLTKHQNHLPVIDLLRGLAALLVCYFHFTTNNSYYGNYLPDGNWLKVSGKYGWLGVEMFFSKQWLPN